MNCRCNPPCGSCRRGAEGERRKLDALADRAAAERWLAAHPELPDPDGEEPPVEGSLEVLFSIHPTNSPGAAVAAAAPGMEG